MATIGNTVLTLADWANRLDPDGKTADIVELLSQYNEMLDDMTWIEGNLPTGTRTTVRTGLPTVAYRKLNSGTTPSKSTTAQIDDAAAILEGWSEVDCDEAMLNGNTFAYRLSESAAFLEAMAQTQNSSLDFPFATILSLMPTRNRLLMVVDLVQTTVLSGWSLGALKQFMVSFPKVHSLVSSMRTKEKSPSRILPASVLVV
jgi:hypothetical protein